MTKRREEQDSTVVKGGYRNRKSAEEDPLTETTSTIGSKTISDLCLPLNLAEVPVLESLAQAEKKLGTLSFIFESVTNPQ